MVNDYEVELGQKTAVDVFNEKLSAKVLEFNKKYKPFDEPCARLEYRDKLETAEKESERRHGFVNVKELNVDVGDLDKYGNEDRFILVEDQEAYVDKVIEGSRTQVVLGHTLSYKCKQRGHGISVFVPNEEYKKIKLGK